jgi:carboxymethylenebutenolidase
MLANVDQRQVATENLVLPNGANALLARPNRPGPYPTILALHEIYGIVQHSRDFAVRIAADGYLSLTPNLYFRLPELAMARHEAEFSDEQAAQDMSVAIEYLKRLDGADTSQLAVVGACATGRYPLIAAADHQDIAACVILYGAAFQRDWEPVDAVSDYALRSKAPVLGVYGELDHHCSLERVQRVRAALEAANRSYHIKVFHNVRHAFLDDTAQPLGRGPYPYPRPQGDDAWRLIITFLERVRNGGYPADRVQWIFDADYSVKYDFTKLQR